MWEQNEDGRNYFSVFKRVLKIAKSDYQLRHVCPSVSLSACNNLVHNRRIFMKFDIGLFSKNVVQILVSLKTDKNNGYFTWRPIQTFDRISLSSS
jgi:hypothetical protein